MQKPWKIGLLILLLAIPIFFVLFLELFSTSHYTIPVYYEDGIDSLSQCEPSQEPHRVSQLQAFDVVNQQSLQLEFTGNARIIYNLSANCRESCALILEELARVQGILEEQIPVEIVILSDSASVTPALLEKYGLKQSKWKVLEGTEVQYPSFLQCELVLPRENIPLHETLVLVDDQSRIRGYYHGTDTEEVDRLIAELRILQYNLKENNSNAEDRAG